MNSEIRVIPASRLSVDPKIQRPLDAKRVKDIAQGWSDSAVGILTVSDRGGNSLVVIDGQTRLAALRAVAGEGARLELRCDTYSGLMEHEEAELFLRHNDRKAVRPLDRFRIALVAREEWAVEIHAILTESGWRAVGTDSDIPDTKTMNAITAVERVYRGEPMALDSAMRIITAAWGHENGAACAHTVYGIGYLFLNHPHIDASALLGKLRKMHSWKFIADVDDLRRRARDSIKDASYEAAVNLYNRGRSAATRIEA